MNPSPDLERLYLEAKEALAEKDYDRAAEALKQILRADENYRDASRLLAEIIKIKRRRWYNDMRIWGPAIGVAAAGLLLWLAPKIALPARAEPTATLPVTSPTTIVTTSPLQTPTLTPSPMPTAIPLQWKRLYTGQVFILDTITAIVMDPQDADVFYAGTQNAGIYKSIDRGDSWQPAFAGLESTNIQSLVIDPADTRILYAGTGSGLYQTTDGGGHWQNRYSSPGKNLVVIDPQDSHHLFYSDGGSIRVSLDGAISWKFLSRFDGEIASLLMDPLDTHTLYVSVIKDEKTTLYRSINDGVDWALVASMDMYGLSMAIDTQGQIVYLGGMDGVFYRYSVKEDILTKMRSQGGCGKIAFHPTDPAIAYCGIEVAIYRTIDGGENWTQLVNPHLYQVTTLAVSSKDPQILLAGGSGMALSVDGGITWAQISSGLPRRTMDIKMDPLDPSTLYIEKFFKLTADPNFIYRSTDAGRTWMLLRSDGCEVNFTSKGNLSCLDGYVNYIKNWITSSSCCITGFSANPLHSQTMLAGLYADDRIFVSQDGGSTWKSASGGFKPVDSLEFFFDHDQGQVIYAVDEWSAAYRSEDWGNTWSRCLETNAVHSSSASCFAIDYADSDHVFLATRGGGLLSSRDGCNTWESNPVGIDNSYVYTVATDPTDPNVIYAGTDGGAYISLDGGDTWQEINDGLLGATVVYSIVVEADGSVYAATPYGVFTLENK